MLVNRAAIEECYMGSFLIILKSSRCKLCFKNINEYEYGIWNDVYSFDVMIKRLFCFLTSAVIWTYSGN